MEWCNAADSVAVFAVGHSTPCKPVAVQHRLPH
jgi:hypothetical protein